MATKLKKQKFFFANLGLDRTIVQSTLFTTILVGLFNVYLLGFILVFVFYPHKAVDTFFWKWICSNDIKRTIFTIDSSNFRITLFQSILSIIEILFSNSEWEIGFRIGEIRRQLEISFFYFWSIE